MPRGRHRISGAPQMHVSCNTMVMCSTGKKHTNRSGSGSSSVIRDRIIRARGGQGQRWGRENSTVRLLRRIIYMVS